MPRNRTRTEELSEPVFEELVQVGAASWEEFLVDREGAFQHLIPADSRAARPALEALRPRADTFLELGSGCGVLTVLADLLGFEAYGIELEPELLRRSHDLGEQFSSEATFVEGSFVPPAFRDDLELVSSDFLTLTEGADAYEELGMELSDFDVVYGYPWPGEEEWMREIVRRFGGDHTRFLTFSVKDGFWVESLSSGA